VAREAEDRVAGGAERRHAWALGRGSQRLVFSCDQPLEGVQLISSAATKTISRR